MFLGIAILFVAIVPASLGYEDIHTYMSPQEVARVFHTDVDSVPEYEVVKVHVSDRLHKRALPAGSRLQLKAMGNDINLWLHPSDSFLAGVDTPVYYAKSSPSATEGVEFRHQPGLMGVIGKIYEDPNKLASLVIGQDVDGRTTVNGYIESSRVAVRSLPSRVVEEYRRRRRSVDDDIEHPQYSPYHVVIKMDETVHENYSHPPVNSTIAHERISRSATEVPETLYPEILVMVEHSVYTTYDTPYGHDIYGLLEYLLAFWNGVDLKYRSLDSPKFRLNLAGIVLAEDPHATPYISRYSLTPTAFNASAAIIESKNFWYRVKDTFPLDSFDIAATMTRHQFGIDSGVLGMAWVASICQKDDYWKTISAVPLYKDDGVFSGAHVIAHELGHVFGAHHDSTTITPECLTQDGYIMAFTPWYTTNSSDFSSCTLRQFQVHLDEQHWTCMYNPPKNIGTKLPKALPGRMMNVDAQCKNHRGGVSCQNQYPQHSVCVNMFCLDSNNECTETGVAALDGTDCGGKNDFCLHQKCVRL